MKSMKDKIFVKIIAFIELAIGLTTFLGLVIYSSLSMSQKPFNVFIFVLLTSIVSILIGLGLLTYKDLARKAIIFFALYIILTKLMIFSNLLQFNGEIITFVPTDLKNLISIAYHSLVIIIFNRKDVKESFIKGPS